METRLPLQALIRIIRILPSWYPILCGRNISVSPLTVPLEGHLCSERDRRAIESGTRGFCRPQSLSICEVRIDISCYANPRSLARRQVSWKEGKPCYIGERRARGLSKSERQPHPLARRAVGWRGATLGGDTARLDVAVLSNRRWRAFLLSHSGFEVRSVEEPELPKAATARCSSPRGVKWSAEGLLSAVDHSPTASTAARVY
jgi:hypothetical protein